MGAGSKSSAGEGAGPRMTAAAAPSRQDPRRRTTHAFTPSLPEGMRGLSASAHDIDPGVAAARIAGSSSPSCILSPGARP